MAYGHRRERISFVTIDRTQFGNQIRHVDNRYKTRVDVMERDASPTRLEARQPEAPKAEPTTQAKAPRRQLCAHLSDRGYCESHEQHALRGILRKKRCRTAIER